MTDTPNKKVVDLFSTLSSLSSEENTSALPEGSRELMHRSFPTIVSTLKEAIKNEDWDSVLRFCRDLVRMAAKNEKLHSQVLSVLKPVYEDAVAKKGFEISKHRSYPIGSRMASAARKIKQVERLSILLRIMS